MPPLLRMRKSSILGQKAQHDEMLAFISDFRDLHEYSPSVKEIAGALHYRSTSTVLMHLRVMEAKGLITKGSGGQPRTVVLTDEGKERVRIRKELLGGK
jgi:DNA-binding MarR family transcriptional regulator